MKRLSLLWLLLLPAATSALTDATASSQRWRQYAQGAATLEPARRFPYESCFRQAASAHHVPLTLLLAVARGESDFNARAVSNADALGLMQIRWPQTARHLGIDSKQALFEPCTNVDAGARYLREMMQRYDGNLHLSLAAYNYGPGRIRPGSGSIPAGADWYSGYILRHLDYVLGQRSAAAKAGLATDYGAEQRLEVIRFARPYRATALIDSLQRRRPTLRLDVFRRHDAKFSVVLLFANAAERRQGLKQLKTLGLIPATLASGNHHKG